MREFFRLLFNLPKKFDVERNSPQAMKPEVYDSGNYPSTSSELNTSIFVATGVPIWRQK